VFTRTGTEPGATYTPQTGALTGSEFFVCENNAITETAPKWSPDRTTPGICGGTSCYYKGGQADQNGKCIPTGAWVRDDYCAQGEWTTRTRMLADDLLATIDGGIVHCDTVPESINRPNPLTPFTTSTANIPPRINSVCVAQTTTSPPTVVVGMTLNNAPGQTASIEGQQAGPAILAQVGTGQNQRILGSILNHSKLDISIDRCTEVNSWPKADEYNLCQGTAGAVYYNTELALVAFTTNQNAAVRQGVRETELQDRLSGIVPGQISAGRVYSYTNPANEKQIDGVVRVEGQGSTRRVIGTIVYRGIDPTKHVNTRFAGNNRVTLTTSNGVTVVRITNPTQNEWEYFTLQLRP
jgi:hypothetical protein